MSNSNETEILILNVTKGDATVSAALPDDGQIRRGIAELAPGTDSFLSLSKDEDSYIQILKSSPGSFYIDYREKGFKNNLYAEDVPLEGAEGILLKYAHGEDFRAGFEWKDTGDGVSFEEYMDDAINNAAFQAGLSGEFEREFVFNDTQDPKEIQGHVGYHGLADWWLSELSSDEREAIEMADHENSDLFDSKAFEEWSDRVLGEDSSGDEEDLDYLPEDADELDAFVTDGTASTTRGVVKRSPYTTTGYLVSLAGMVNREGTRPLAIKLCDKAMSLLDSPGEAVDVEGDHSTYGGLMEAYYRSRDEIDGCLDKAIKCAEAMIALAPEAAKNDNARFNGKLPTHNGFKQLSIIREKQGNLPEAMRLSRQALEQGWDGDWEKRIERYEKKLAKKK